MYLGNHPQIPLSIISTGMIGGLACTGYFSDLTLPYYCGVSLMYLHTLWQIWTADINDSKNLWLRFESNIYSGGILTAAIIAGHF